MDRTPESPSNDHEIRDAAGAVQADLGSEHEDLWERCRTLGVTRRSFLNLLQVGGPAAVLVACASRGAAAESGDLQPQAKEPVLAELTAAFGRVITLPYDDGTAYKAMADVFASTVGWAMDKGETWPPRNRPWIIRQVRKIARGAERRADADLPPKDPGPGVITGKNIRDSAAEVIPMAKSQCPPAIVEEFGPWCPESFNVRGPG